jgi:hypothetical protein
MTKDFNNITACQKLNIKEQVEKTYMSYNFKSCSDAGQSSKYNKVKQL